MESADDAVFRIDARDADACIGKHLLVALRYYDRRGRLVERRQLHGIIVAVSRVLTIKTVDSGRPFTLPPQVRRAPPGLYRFRKTGEEIQDPDLLAEWSIYQRDRHRDATERRLRTARLRRERRLRRRAGAGRSNSVGPGIRAD